MTIDMLELGKAAKTAARQLRLFDTEAKNQLLLNIADALEAKQEFILAENAKDMAAAEAAGMAFAMLDRLNLAKRLPAVIQDTRRVAELPDPVGREYDERSPLDGLVARRRRVPIGVIGAIYESRPDVTVDISVLALKTGNTVILRGGSETLQSNIALVETLQGALARTGFPAEAVQLIADTDRKYVGELLKLHRYVDMIIPRGGAKLHEFCREHSTIPVITGGLGICHIYVDASADLESALEIIHNAKTQRPSACNSINTLLIQRSLAHSFIPRVIDRLRTHQVTFKVAAELGDLVNEAEKIYLAEESDWDIEWSDYILGVKVVANLDEAIDHIEQHGTAHSDAILTQDAASAERFLNEVDSAAVYVNASTRFTDGSALGLGAEVAVSTQKLHARGPMALEELTTYKWVVEGTGHIRP